MRLLNRRPLARRFAMPVIRTASVQVIEQLEPRRFLNATLVSAIAPVNSTAGGAPTTINASSNFNDPTIVGTAIEIQTPQGNIPLMLFDSQTPQTVANFEHYITSGEYKNVLVHRSIPGFVIQGGGYTADGNHIATAAPVQGEPGISNTTGTIAMALSSGPNSGTSEWFINLGNNNAPPTNLDDTSDGGPFTAFGTVIYNGMSVVNAIAALPVGNAGSFNGAWTNLPVKSIAAGITPSNLVVTNVVNVAPLSFSATSDNPALVNPVISGNNVVLNYGNADGTANVTVTATDLGGNTVTSTFAVNLTGAAPPLTVNLASGLSHEVRFTDPAGTPGVAFITGPGSGTLTFAGPGLSQSTARSGVVTVSGTPQLVSISTTGTSLASTLSIQSVNGRVLNIAGITTDADLRALTATRVALTGDLTVAGSIKSIALNSVLNGSITISGSGASLALSLSSDNGAAINSSEPIQSIQASSFMPTQGINAPSIARLTVPGQLDTNIATGSLGVVTAGTIGPGTWTITGAVSTITAGGITGLNLAAASVGRISSRNAINNSTIMSAGNIASAAAAILSSSTIEAGSPTLDAGGLPTAFAGSATISTVTIGRGGFSNSLIGAATLGHLALGPVSGSSGGVPFGVVGHQILTLTATVGGKTLLLRNATTDIQVSTAFSHAGIPQGSFPIRVNVSTA